MGNIALEIPYRCDDDCVPEGCPGHTLVVNFQTTANWISFCDSRGREYSTDIGGLKAMLKALKLLEYRVEIADALKILEDL